MSAADCPWRVTTGGIALRIRVTPKSSRDMVAGMRATAEGIAVQVHVRAAPSDGEANSATALAIAGWLGLPRSKVSVVAGHKSRVKTIAIDGPAASLEDLVGNRIAAFP